MSELDSVPFYSDHFRVSTPQRPGAGRVGWVGAKSASRPKRPKFPQNARDAPPQPPHPPQIEKFRRPLHRDSDIVRKRENTFLKSNLRSYRHTQLCPFRTEALEKALIYRSIKVQKNLLS